MAQVSFYLVYYHHAQSEENGGGCGTECAGRRGGGGGVGEGGGWRRWLAVSHLRQMMAISRGETERQREWIKKGNAIVVRNEMF